MKQLIKIKQFFCEDGGTLSMKRLCGLICTLSLCIKLINNPTDALVYSVATLAAASLGLTTAEKIWKKGNKND
jgi:hypothetical protein